MEYLGGISLRLSPPPYFCLCVRLVRRSTVVNVSGFCIMSMPRVRAARD